MNIHQSLSREDIDKEIDSYKKMLKKYGKEPGHISFYCLPAGEKDIPLTGGEYLGDTCYCPRCKLLMEKRNIQRGCGSITAFYCQGDNLYWVLDCWGIKPSTKWYGPFPGYPNWVVQFMWTEEWYLPLSKQMLYKSDNK